jgi:hypothetical protein
MTIEIDEAGTVHGPMVVQIPGIPGKQNSRRNAGDSFALHSIVGQESEFQDGVPNRFMDTSTYYDPAYGVYRFTPYAAASVQVVLRKFDTVTAGYATLIQMYPLTSSTWTSGGSEANERFLSMEMEGGGYLPDGTQNFGEPMNDLQVATWTEYVGALEGWNSRRLGRPFRLVEGDNLLQHKQVAARYGYDPTACASDRYARGLAALREGNTGMSPQEKKITGVAWGDYDYMKLVYDKLVKLGRIPGEGLALADDSLNAAVVKRGRVMQLVATDPGAADLM